MVISYVETTPPIILIKIQSDAAFRAIVASWVNFKRSAFSIVAWLWCQIDSRNRMWIWCSA
jgi:hypothetical protein